MAILIQGGVVGFCPFIYGKDYEGMMPYQHAHKAKEGIAINGDVPPPPPIPHAINKRCVGASPHDLHLHHIGQQNNSTNIFRSLIPLLEQSLFIFNFILLF